MRAQQAEAGVAEAEFVRRAVRGQDRRIVPGIGVAQFAGRQPQHAVEERDEASLAQVGGERLVDARAEVGRAHVRAGQRLDRRLQVGHHERRGKPLAGDVGDADRDRVGREPPRIVVVAADGQRRMPRARDRERVGLGQLLRQQRTLVVEGFLERCVVLARLDVGDGHRRLRRQRRQDLHVPLLPRLVGSLAAEAEHDGDVVALTHRQQRLDRRVAPRPALRPCSIVTSASTVGPSRSGARCVRNGSAAKASRAVGSGEWAARNSG